MKLKRTISALLLLAMLLSCLPFTALAAETEAADVGDAPTSEITKTADTDSIAEPVTLALEADDAHEPAAADPPDEGLLRRGRQHCAGAAEQRLQLHGSESAVFQIHHKDPER